MRLAALFIESISNRVLCGSVWAASGQGGRAARAAPRRPGVKSVALQASYGSLGPSRSVTTNNTPDGDPLNHFSTFPIIVLNCLYKYCFYCIVRYRFYEDCFQETVNRKVLMFRGNVFPLTLINITFLKYIFLMNYFLWRNP